MTHSKTLTARQEWQALVDGEDPSTLSQSARDLLTLFALHMREADNVLQDLRELSIPNRNHQVRWLLKHTHSKIQFHAAVALMDRKDPALYIWRRLRP